jgi:hypothetical protein
LRNILIALASASGASPVRAVNARLLDAEPIRVLPFLRAVSGLFRSQDIHDELIQSHNDWLLRVHAEHERAVLANRQAAAPVDVGDGRQSPTAFPSGKNCFAQRYGRPQIRTVRVKRAEHKGGTWRELVHASGHSKHFDLPCKSGLLARLDFH